jgi:hypothetical protein
MARRVCSRADEALCAQFKLRGWVHRTEGRRELYFAWCDHARRELRLLAGGSLAKDSSVVQTLIAALGEDESFAGYVRARGGSFLTDDGNWDRLFRAGAATILEEYLEAVDKGRWP